MKFSWYVYVVIAIFSLRSMQTLFVEGINKNAVHNKTVLNSDCEIS
jgi:hypothetical protein